MGDSKQPEQNHDVMHDDEMNQNDGGDKIVREENSVNLDVAKAVVITGVEPFTLSKKFTLNDNGELEKSNGGNLITGNYDVKEVPDPASLTDLFKSLRHFHATTYGLPKKEYYSGMMVCKALEQKGLLTRTRENFAFPSGPAWMMFDIDMQNISMDQLKEHFKEAIPGFEQAPAVFKHSSSAYIYNGDECLIGDKGKRVYVLVKNGQDIVRAAKAIADRLKIQGTLYYDVSKAGSLLERCLIDEAVYQPERLDFSGSCLCVQPLRQKRPEPEIQNNDAPPFDTKVAVLDLDDQEQKILEMMRGTAKEKVKDQVIEIRGKWIETCIEVREKKSSKKFSSDEKARLRAELQETANQKILHENFILHSERHGQVTVGELLKDPERWHGKRFADPLEPDYNNDSRIATAYLKDEERPSIWSFAHGGQRFWLTIQKKTLKYKTGGYPALVKDCMNILKDSGVVYQKDKELVRVSNGQIYPVTEPWLRNRLDTCVCFKKEKVTNDGTEYLTKDCPGEIPKRILAAVGEWPFFELDKIVDLPVMREDGSILGEPGYDPGTKLILLSGTCHEVMEKVPENPTNDDVKKALERIWAPFQLFPFKDPIDIGVFLSVILTIPVRSSLTKAPGCLFRAPVYGSGKSKLAESIGEMTNKPYALLPWPNYQEEQRKATTAELRRGPEVLIFDNLIGTWSSPDLAKIFTTGLHSDRILGKTEMVDFKIRSMIMGTGNNVTVDGDLARRIMPCELDPQAERPDKLEFPFDPVYETRNNVLQMRADVLTVLRAFIKAGRPRNTKDSFGSFEQWDGLVRQAVCWIAKNKFFPVDIGDPYESINSNFQEDPGTKKLRAFLYNFYKKFQDNPFTVREVVAASAPMDAGFQSSDGYEEIDNCYAILWDIAGQGKTLNTRMLGKWLSKNTNRIIDDMKIVKSPMRNGISTYSLVLTKSSGLSGLSGSNPDRSEKKIENNYSEDDWNLTHQTHQTHYNHSVESEIKRWGEADHGFDL